MAFDPMAAIRHLIGSGNAPAPVPVPAEPAGDTFTVEQVREMLATAGTAAQQSTDQAVAAVRAEFSRASQPTAPVTPPGPGATAALIERMDNGERVPVADYAAAVKDGSFEREWDAKYPPTERR